MSQNKSRIETTSLIFWLQEWGGLWAMEWGAGSWGGAEGVGRWGGTIRVEKAERSLEPIKARCLWLPSASPRAQPPGDELPGGDM